jgi:FlaA1/EpsC-like NDP-sugar epimerase
MNRSLEITNKMADLLIINLCWWIAYYLRFESNLLEADQGVIGWYIKYSVLLTILNYYYFRSRGVYRSKALTSMQRDLFTLVGASTLAFVVFIVASYFLSQFKLSRLFIITYFLLSTTMLMAFKVFFRKFLRARGEAKECLLVGNSEQIQAYANKIDRNPEYGIKVKEWLKTDL